MPASTVESRGGRKVVLKPLDDDCLLDGDLHPSIRLRLCRIRELPMTMVANLHGVEIIDDKAVLVWDYIPGKSLEEVAQTLTESQRHALRQELQLLVERLHGYGIVHGDLHARNIILDDRGRLHLTHVSPLLHNDPEKDIAAIDAMLPSSPLPPGEGRVSADGAASQSALTPTLSRRERGQETNPRALVGAGVAFFVGVIIVISAIWFSQTS